MRRITLNFLVDVFAFVCFGGLSGTGLVIKYILEPGTGRGWRGGKESADVKTFLSLSRHEWGTIHFWFSVVFIVFVVVHIVLHYKWVKAYVQSIVRRKKRPIVKDRPFFYL